MSIDIVRLAEGTDSSVLSDRLGFKCPQKIVKFTDQSESSAALRSFQSTVEQHISTVGGSATSLVGAKKHVEKKDNIGNSLKDQKKELTQTIVPERKIIEGSKSWWINILFFLSPSF